MKPQRLARWCWLSGVVIVAGCSMDTPGGKGTTNAPTSNGTKKIKIAALGFQNDQFFKTVEIGIKDAAGKAGVELSLGNSGGSLDKEIQLVDTYTAAKVDALLVAPTNPKASIPAIEKAYKAGIRVITYDSALDATFPISNIKSDQVSLGQASGEAAAKYIQEKLGGKARVAIISYLSLLPEPASQRNLGFERELSKLPGVKIVARQDAWMAEKALNVVEGILSAHPEINVIWAANEGGTVGAVTAVRNSGKAGKVVVFGTDISEQIAGFLLDDDNVLQAVTGQKPFDIGTKALLAAVASIKGEKVDSTVRLPGELFSRTNADAVKSYRKSLRSMTK